MNYFDDEIHTEMGDTGSHFYHSYVDFQAISAHGLLIVEDCEPPPYHYDEGISLLWADYYNKTDKQVVGGLVASPFIWSGETNALVVNGQSGTTSLSNATDASCAPYILNVFPGKTYRIRFIAATAISLITLGIEAHSNLTIIEADGT